MKTRSNRILYGEIPTKKTQQFIHNEPFGRFTQTGGKIKVLHGKNYNFFNTSSWWNQIYNLYQKM
jgi:hypothetical protein